MSVKKSQLLKQLQTRKAKLEVDVQQLGRSAKEAQKDHAKAQQQLEHVKKEITEATDTEPTVTEHAIIRYLERVMGLDLDNIRAEILCPGVTLQIKSFGSGKYPIGDGHKAVVKGQAVVSIV